MFPAGPMNAKMVLLGLFLIVGLLAMLGAWVFAIVWVANGNSLLPRGKVRAVPWGIGSVVLAAFLWLGSQVGFGVLYHSMTDRGKPKPAAGKVVQGVAAKPPAKAVGDELSKVEIMGLVSASNLATVLLIPVLLAMTSRARLADLGIPGGSFFLNVWRGVLAYLLLAPVVFAVMFAAIFVWIGILKHPAQPHPVAEMLSEGLTRKLIVLATIAAAVAAPLAEEFLFRGVFLGWLTRVWNRVPKPKPKPEPEADLVNPWPEFVLHEPVEAVVDTAALTSEPRPSRVSFLLPNIIVSMIFAGLHYQQWPAPIALFVLSIGLGILYQRTGSLIAPIALHATFNGVSTSIMFLAVTAGVPIVKAKEAAPAMIEASGSSGPGIPSRLIISASQDGEKVVATPRSASYKGVIDRRSRPR